MSNPERWAVYLEYLTDRSKRGKINEIVGMEEGIGMASGVLLTISRDEEERARIMRDEKIELDYQSYMSWAKKEGRKIGLEEGRMEGRAEGRMEIVDMLKSGKNRDEIIAEYESQEQKEP